jgi:molybdopterin converting factor small subunit
MTTFTSVRGIDAWLAANPDHPDKDYMLLERVQLSSYELMVANVSNLEELKALIDEFPEIEFLTVTVEKLRAFEAEEEEESEIPDDFQTLEELESWAIARGHEYDLDVELYREQFSQRGEGRKKVRMNVFLDYD